MRIGKGFLLLSLLSLAGCTNLDPRLDPTGLVYSQQVSRMTGAYNAAHGTHYPVPQVNIDAMNLADSVVGAADFTHWSLHINPLWVKKDPCLVDREALAHELAHLFVYYDEYGPPQSAMLSTPLGAKLVAMNGPGLADLGEEHGAAWQVKARALGADPCKEGYCYSERPYRKYPITCAGTETAWVMDRSSAAPGRLDRGN
ncbi:MAG TPA: hypothetical protein VGH71_06865 [Gammaproteobacteria bacterium]|jgi:hypothetical protein